ncbi:hypothetical protein [Protofrankia sp. BMG5.30]|uniref:hypothetical protein n=1 Tax=Protofrankia sp. BMG5.30 TaxID=1834514 RepID=UPI0009777DA8|nr:hypothetical protein [Protofrankia sp. BMG5.30]ONH35646.1 hypothetical protein BL254_10120 [Protofrankia sp. BMG5.30]
MRGLLAVGWWPLPAAGRQAIATIGRDIACDSARSWRPAERQEEDRTMPTTASDHAQPPGQVQASGRAPVFGRTRVPGRTRLVGRLAGTAAVVAMTVGLAGCGAVSEETRQAGTDALCSQIEARAADVRASVDVARLVALTVRDLAPDGNVRQLADQVSHNPGDLELRGQLADWIDNKCSG